MFHFVGFSLVLTVALASAVPPVLYREHRADPASLQAIIENLPESTNGYELQIVPVDEYEVAKYQPFSLWSLITSPFTAITEIGSTALSVGKWVFVNGGLILLGAGLLVGFCAFTPYCTLTIYKPYKGRNGKSSFGYSFIDDLEEYFKQAYQKYQKINEVK